MHVFNNQAMAQLMKVTLVGSYQVQTKEGIGDDGTLHATSSLIVCDIKSLSIHDSSILQQ